MKNELKRNIVEAGSRKANEPCLLFPDTHLCVDLKLITHKQGRLPVGEYLHGTITRDQEDHFRFVENAEGLTVTDGLIEEMEVTE
jgi:hypothetical protein